MNQLKNSDIPQVLYQGRWVNREHFRVFVYNGEGQKLANSYDEYMNLISSGLWWNTKEEVDPKEPIQFKSVASKKAKHGANS